MEGPLSAPVVVPPQLPTKPCRTPRAPASLVLVLEYDAANQVLLLCRSCPARLLQGYLNKAAGIAVLPSILKILHL
jgi:hypothetical protein